MSWEKFTMYLATIPDFSTDEKDTEGEKEKPTTTGSFSLFDFDTKF